MWHTFHESKITWQFDATCNVIAYDDSSWYRNHFVKCAGSAAVDFVAVDNGVAWLVEVRDFTTTSPHREKGPFWEVITRKVLDTLGGLVAGSLNAGNPLEQTLFHDAVRAREIRVVVHCERPKHKTRLFSSLLDHADLQQKLQGYLRALDKHVKVADCNHCVVGGTMASDLEVVVGSSVLYFMGFVFASLFI